MSHCENPSPLSYYRYFGDDHEKRVVFTENGR